MIAAVALAAALALPGGGQYIMHRDATAATAALDVWYRVPSAGYDNQTPGIARMAIAAIAASAPPHGVSLAALVQRDGGSLTINVYPDIAMIGASVPAWQAPAVMRALTAAFFSPSITDAGFHAALRDSAIASAEQQFNAEQTLQNALFTRMFSSGPAHYAPIPPAPDFAKLTIAQTRQFAQRAFRQPNAVVSAAGAVDASLAADARTSPLGSTTVQDQPFDSRVSASPVDAIVTAPVTGLGVAFTGPPISDEKAATAMDFIADYLFDPDRGALSQALQGQKDVFVSGQFITLHDPGVLIGTIAGAGAATQRARILQTISELSTPLDGKTFEAARNAFLYHIFAESETPSGHADNAGWYAVEGNAQYAPGDPSRTYVQLAQSLDPRYVASIAAKYLQHPAFVQLLTAPRSGSST